MKSTETTSRFGVLTGCSVLRSYLATTAPVLVMFLGVVLYLELTQMEVTLHSVISTQQP